MKRFIGIICCLFLFFASAAWALGKCQSLVAHHDGHEYSDSVTHTDSHELDIPREQSLPGDPVIHCVNSGENLSFISASSPRVASLIGRYKVLPSSFVPVIAEANGWITYGEKRPPGWFLAAVSPYLSLLVLRV